MKIDFDRMKSEFLGILSSKNEEISKLSGDVEALMKNVT